MVLSEVAELLGVAEKTLRRWDAVGYGPRATRRGLKRVYVYNEREVRRWLASVAEEDTVEITVKREVA
jgi:DNA-binding transcriptional MerR regulator